MHRLYQSEKGQAVILFVVLLPTVIILLGFVLDIARLHIVRARLQTAVDAASLAGASVTREIVMSDNWGNIYGKYQKLDKTAAEQTAYSCLIANIEKIPQAVLLSSSVWADPSTCSVQVEARVRVPTCFINIFGKLYMKATRKAKAAAISN